MSLDYGLGDIANWQQVCFVGEEVDGARRMNIATETLIFATLVIGHGEITELNVCDFYVRLEAHERLFGGMRRRGVNGEQMCFTFEEVYAHIGLRTNASKESDAAFWKRTRERYVEERMSSVKIANNNLKAAAQHLAAKVEA